jgi:asparagine synthase (glutamine-hydrolysing)
MRVAINHSGLGPMLGAVLFGRSLPAEAAVYPPRIGAVTPADAAVVRPPWQPDDVASSLVAALRLALARDHWRTLAGVAIVSADDAGCRVLGFAPGPVADAAPHPRTLVSLALADNPAGQGAQRTPIVIVAQQTAASVERALHSAEAPVGTVGRAR